MKNEHWVEKSMTIPTSMNHYGVAKMIVETLESLRKRDHNVAFRLRHYSNDDTKVSSVVFTWKEKETLDA